MACRQEMLNLPRHLLSLAVRGVHFCSHNMTKPIVPTSDEENTGIKRCSHAKISKTEGEENCQEEKDEKDINERDLACLMSDNEGVDAHVPSKEKYEGDGSGNIAEKEYTRSIFNYKSMDSTVLPLEHNREYIWSFAGIETNLKENVESQDHDPQESKLKSALSAFILGLRWIRVMSLRFYSIFLMYCKNGIYAPKGRKRRKFSMSEHPIRENIRYYVKSFFMEMCNKKLRNFSLTKYLRTFRFPNFQIPSSFTVFPAYTLGEYYREIESNPNMTFRETMQYDMLRTSTFSKFPSNCPVSTLLLAKAGFYYEGKADEVICFKCGIKHRYWKHLDDPILIHVKISPSCPFARNLERGNGTSSSVYRSGNDASILYRREDERRCNTFSNDTRNDPSNSHNESTSYTGTTQNAYNSSNGIDSVQDTSLRNGGENNVSSSSESRIAVVNSNDTSARPPQSSEERTSHPSFTNNSTPVLPTQGYASSYENIPTCRSSDVTSHIEGAQSQNIAASTGASTAPSTTTSNAHPKSAASTLEPLGISIEKPKYPQYAVLATRISSFRNWPEHLHQKPEDLAKAGFLYEGTNDFTRCFFCAGGLRDWEPEDIPWIEHARWYKNCVFVRQCKGEDFVNLVQQGKIQEAMGKLEGCRKHTKDHIDDILRSTASLSVQEMGYDLELIKKAIETISRNQDLKTMTADSLLQCVWELEEGGSKGTTDQRNTNLIHTTNRNTENESRGSPTSDNTAESTESLLAENRQLKEQQICKICMDEDISIVFLPCGHMATCVNCAPAVRKCPLCRRFIKGTVKAILS